MGREQSCINCPTPLNHDDLLDEVAACHATLLPHLVEHEERKAVRDAFCCRSERVVREQSSHAEKGLKMPRFRVGVRGYRSL